MVFLYPLGCGNLGIHISSLFHSIYSVRTSLLFYSETPRNNRVLLCLYNNVCYVLIYFEKGMQKTGFSTISWNTTYDFLCIYNFYVITLSFE